MTEQDWLTSENPADMLNFLLGRGQGPAGSHGGRTSLRKLRLFTVSSLRYLLGRGEPPMTSTQRAGIEALERFADDENEDGLFEAVRRANLPRPGIALATVAGTRIHASMMTDYSMNDVREHECFALRCIAGNPFRPVRLPGGPNVQCPLCKGERVRRVRPVGASSRKKFTVNCQCCRGRGVIPAPCPWLTRNDGAVVKLATVIYDSRDWGLMPILADALEEAGCVGERCSRCNGSGTYTVHVTNAGLSAANGYSALTTYSEWRGCRNCGGDHDREGTGTVPHPILAHLRGPGPHARGCHVLDLILGKE